MADRLKDQADLKLAALFESAPIADDGFSRRIVTRVRRQIWVRRLTLPVAFIIGAAVAARPLTHLVEAVSGLFKFIPQTLANNLGAMPIAEIPQLPTIVLGVAILLVALMAGKLTRQY